MRKLLPFLALALAVPALAQDLPVTDLQAAGNAADRALAACKKRQVAKCLTDTRTAEAAIDRALAVLDPPAPTPTPVPTPSPTPVPTPTPTAPSVLSEGDSLSVFWSGNHTGIFAKENPQVTFHGKAVGGSGVSGLEQRFAANAALDPDVVTVFIGANDLSRWDSTTADPWLADLWNYVGKWKATGAKVLVGTVLGQCIPTLPAHNVKFNGLRAVANNAIRAAVGTKIDGVIDFAADPVMGTDAAACDKALFSDGVHPTDGSQGVGEGGQAKLARVYGPAVKAALAGAPLPDAPHDGHDMPVSGWVPSPSLEGAPELVAEFPIEEGLKPSWGSGAIPGLYGGGEGAFRFTCGGEGTLNYDDPLVYPGKKGASHLHYYWGPPVDAFTTMDTLAASVGNSNCNYGDKTVNRSSYWSPALLDLDGFVRLAEWVAVYYKRPTASSPRCTPGSPTFQGICLGLPNQIRYVWGWNQFEPDQPGQGASWYCTGSGSLHAKSIEELFNAGCKAGDTLIADMVAPDCWDGKFLDSPDHRAHMAYSSYGTWGYKRCPATHPYVIPQNESKVAWTVTADMIEALADGTKRSRVLLASDHMKPGAKPGETLHSDYMEQWVGAAKRMWEEGCINKGLDCSGGDLGNGLQLVGASQPSYGWANPNPRVPVPARH